MPDDYDSRLLLRANRLTTSSTLPFAFSSTYGPERFYNCFMPLFDKNTVSPLLGPTVSLKDATMLLHEFCRPRLWSQCGPSESIHFLITCLVLRPQQVTLPITERSPVSMHYFVAQSVISHPYFIHHVPDVSKPYLASASPELSVYLHTFELFA